MQNWVNWMNIGKSLVKLVADSGVVYVVAGVVDSLVPKGNAWKKICVGAATIVLSDVVVDKVNESIDKQFDSVTNTLVANQDAIIDFANKVESNANTERTVVS